ncbi:MAG: TolC family protein [Myxococcales bacterium]|nr:TolC family protein [Myxococcales bacterium]
MDDPERLPGPPASEIDLSSSERLALSRSLDLALARQRFTAAAKRANLARVEGLLPEVRAGVAAEKEINESRWGVGPAVGLELPLFYQGQGEVAAARAEMRRQARLHDVTAIQVRSAARTTAATLSVARERVRFYETVLLPLRERVVAETQLQYNAMNAGVFQLIAAKRDQVETGRAYVEALRDYWLTRAEHEQLSLHASASRNDEKREARCRPSSVLAGHLGAVRHGVLPAPGVSALGCGLAGRSRRRRQGLEPRAAIAPRRRSRSRPWLLQRKGTGASVH